MIESVATTLPTYVMSSFQLPKTITTTLTTAVARFWWSTIGQQKKLHWLAWKNFCRTKAEGGIGFRTMDEYYTALLAKKCWRLIEFSNSLNKVFKGCYHRKIT